MRGKDIMAKGLHEPLRITPAYAGKRGRHHAGNWRNQDHPRLCGEKAGTANGKFKLQGSPPPMRGKAIDKHSEMVYNRITPAYAGKSRTWWSRCGFF